MPAAVEPGSCRDASDEIVLGAAVAGRAHVIVSGDKDLLTLGRFHSVRIVTPREFREAAQEG